MHAHSFCCFVHGIGEVWFSLIFTFYSIATCIRDAANINKNMLGLLGFSLMSMVEFYKNLGHLYNFPKSRKI